MGKLLEQQALQQLPQTAESIVQQQQLAPQQPALPSLQQLPHRIPHLQLATNNEVVGAVTGDTADGVLVVLLCVISKLVPLQLALEVFQLALQHLLQQVPQTTQQLPLSRQSGEVMRNVFHASLPRIFARCRSAHTNLELHIFQEIS